MIAITARGAVIAHRYTYAPSRCRPRSIAGFSFPCQYLCGTILYSDPVFDGV